MSSNSIPAFQALTGLYEPSAIVQMPDGRFLVVEDEKQQPFSLVTINASGSVSRTALNTDVENNAAPWKLDDLEGLTIDLSGFIYAITSHSRTAGGDEKKSRDKLVRFRIEGDRVVEAKLCTALKSALVSTHAVLAQAAAILDTKADAGLNIEALAISPDPQRLLIGLRGPLLEQRAVIACVENPATLFDADASPRISTRLITLDLGSNGIRDLCYFPALKGYLVISGPVAREQLQFQLWFWSGEHDDPAHRVSVPGLPGFEHAEGISPASIDGQPGLIIVSDDGSRKAERFGRFLLLELCALQIAA